MGGEDIRIGEAAADGRADLRPTPRSLWSGRRSRPSERTVEIVGKLGLRFPPANSVDREAHAARVALLAEDCAGIDPDLLDAASREWARRERFFPKAVELIELTRSVAAPSPRLRRRAEVLGARVQFGNRHLEEIGRDHELHWGIAGDQVRLGWKHKPEGACAA